jgi:dipeptidyl aminopeptidase/acylaminoacyl peptidase
MLLLVARALLCLLAGTCRDSWGQTSLAYQVPPQALVDLVDIKPTPNIEVSRADSTGHKWLLIGHVSGLSSITDLAQPELRLAGVRFNPRTNGPSRGRYTTAFGLRQLPGGKEIAVSGLPADPRMVFAAWAPDARHVSFVNISNESADAGLSLWIIDVATAHAHKVGGVALNGIFGAPCEWLSDSSRLVCRALVDHRGEAPKRPEAPTGPIIQENLGRTTPGATFEDLLKSPEDERLFDYYAASQLKLIGIDGAASNIGTPGVVTTATPSPDGLYLLSLEHHHPYSYLLPFETFPLRVAVIDLRSGATKQVADKPLQDTVPNIHDAVAPGPRDYGWRSDTVATLYWVEASDGGDPRKEVAVRDIVFLLDAPFDAAPRRLVELPLRLARITWSNNRLALVEETRWSDRKRIILGVSPDTPSAPVKWFEGSFEDRYHDPGLPFLEMNAAGKPVAQSTADGSAVYFRSIGASPEGDMPFVATMGVKDGAAKRIWRSAPPYYEYPYTVVDAKDSLLLVRRESQELSPNLYLRDLTHRSWRQVTFFPNPYGSTPLPKKTVLKYKRPDGVDLSANLYLPPGYKPQDGPLPGLLEAYPTEYKTRGAAGQITGSPYAFPFLNWGSPVPFAAMGYAVLESATIPIVGEGTTEPNDTYVEQLVASAKAAIDEGVRMGVLDRNRVAVMGHSYGAFMTANLMAHSNLFKAGIARSGAYNRTLTPFGFQNEERTYWQAPQIYYQMSPFSFADKIRTPILLIHGDADNNSGTFPIQSERFFSAIKGQGGTVRFVLLPLESHGYTARESVLHMLWEMNNWLSTYVIKAVSAPATAEH